MIYLIGSLRNPQIPQIKMKLEELTGEDVFADWFAAGPEADDKWKDYNKEICNSYIEALDEPAAVNVFEFDKRHLLEAKAVVLALPAGKSGHLELGWTLGMGKPGYILLEKADIRWDVMYKFATGVFDDIDRLAGQFLVDFSPRLRFS